MTACPENRRIQELLDEELPPAEALRLREHAASCASCARELALYRRVIHSLERLPTWDPGPVFTARVMERVLPSRVRRRWIRALGFGYASLTALTVAGILAFATQPEARILLVALSTAASRRVAQALVFALNAVSFSVVSLAGSGRLLAETGQRLLPIGRAIAALFSQTAIVVPLTIAVGACAAVLWWMRPRGTEVRNGMRHVGILGF
ncbi:MAG TPA: zf-HC2 domain-containing protein [Candidatus Eisenbacteria bacterium]|jgi:anti-sigma factor RsiW